MVKEPKKVAAIHDISCFGRCSLTVALPILSAAGVNCSVVPTAVLSTHTGGFEGFTYRDLTDDILPIAKHWQDIGLGFDAIYSGFLGSIKQVGLLKEFIRMFRNRDTMVLVDPVMGDDGRLYKTFPNNFPEEMAKTVREADLITPNMTEAALLLGEPFREGPYERARISETIKKLASLGGGNKRVVLSGVYFSENESGAGAYENGEIEYAMAARVPGKYPGTGDVFASVLLAAMLGGGSLFDSLAEAVSFVSESIRRTYEAGADPRFGIHFEESLRRFRV